MPNTESSSAQTYFGISQASKRKSLQSTKSKSHAQQIGDFCA